MTPLNDYELAHMIGAAIRHHRKAKGWDQKDLADQVGTTQADISHRELGYHMPTLPTIIRYAHALGIPPSHLIDHDHDHHP